MACDAHDLRSKMREFLGGSDQRYRHQFNPKLIYTEGMKAVAVAAGAYWLLDMIALQVAPIYAAAWLKGSASVGIVKLEVTESKAKITLLLADGTPDAFTEEISYTDFPPGEWKFYFGTDELGPEQYVTTLMIPEEY